MSENSEPKAGGSAGLPLEGITVVSLEQAVAAPIATRHLADLGARVIKVERIGEGDFARNYDAAVHGLASHFVWLNRGKESICVDLKATEGVAAVRRLVGEADVVIQNFAPGAAARLGLGADELRRERPELIVVNMTGYGTEGPLRERKAYDMLVQAETGLCSITGTPETATKTGIPTSDIAAGMYALTSIQAALFRRERTGAGATIDVSMFDATVEWLGHPMYLQMYQDTQVQRMGLSHASIAPYDAYPTVDGKILIGVQNDRGWRALVTEVFGRPDLAGHPKFATNILRVQHRAETDAVVAENTRRFETAELDKRLAAAGVPAARLNDMKHLIEHPQLAERDRWREVGTEAGAVRAVLPPMTFSDVEMRMGAVPALGQHTDAVLAELGLTDEQVAGLRAAGIVQ
ncbi:L-carnitine dehydratase/bile acid-inducible protein F [Rhodococcus aetherivorans]|uniref:L-carnitine dehydratase/bile acid-inducible protein F n=1 Tax=Rhodococcus aetherivorans TaxID=191292 RepID=A0ABQ0YJA5_9NOCA|nr:MULTISPECIES: CaiB/BaiF CoA-transferase family protein [Rhodococcus]ETT23720.1 Formyl-CoA transferase [Rhodococcus rhodochrous ATCC 21198]NGP27445.1 CoA transferase [Rhodococcus aetherivorans]OLL19112.1 formyl-CoA transferase [Rhodococcus sp. M8]PND52757.1 CoA transferase [Rhodococcus sp. ENV425]QPG47801.1 CoA transferase [Rhodococcus sp. M8]